MVGLSPTNAVGSSERAYAMYGIECMPPNYHRFRGNVRSLSTTAYCRAERPASAYRSLLLQSG